MARKPKFTTGATITRSTLTGKMVWVPWVHDGRSLIQLAPRAHRDEALAEAARHRAAIEKPELPLKVWRPGV